MSVQEVPIDRITTDGSTQPRASIDLFTVNDYAEDMEAGANFPPLSVVFDGEHFWLWDGFHRLAAYVRRQAKAVTCEVRHGTLEDARWLALGANQRHGLRRTNADKRRAVAMALKARPHLSDRAIADHCGVSQPFVGSVRGELLPTDNGYQSPARTGRDGRTIDTSNIGKSSASAPDEPPSLCFADDDEAPPSTPPEPEPSPARKTPQQEAADDPARRWLAFNHELLVYVNSVRDLGGIESLAASWKPAARASAARHLRDLAARFTDWADTLERRES